MKKTIFSLLVLATSLAACTDDYKDWAGPQHNDQPATVQFGNGSVTEVPVINLGEVFDETVQVAQVTASYIKRCCLRRCNLSFGS